MLAEGATFTATPVEILCSRLAEVLDGIHTELNAQILSALGRRNAASNRRARVLLRRVEKGSKILRHLMSLATCRGDNPIKPNVRTRYLFDASGRLLSVEALKKIITEV